MHAGFWQHRRYNSQTEILYGPRPHVIECPAMSNEEPFTTNYTYIKADEKDPKSKPVDYVFLSLDRNLSGEECEELAQRYFEIHNKTTLPGKPLIVDVRPAFRQPLTEVTPKVFA
jgi:hypothetical protein